MRIYAISIVFFFIQVAAISQEAGSYLNKLPIHYINIQIPKSASIQLPFASIEIIDKRFDSSKLGYVKKGDQFYKIMTGQPFAAFCQSALINHFAITKEPQEKTLVMVLHHLWLQETTDAEESDEKTAMQNNKYPNLFSQCFAGIDVYRKEGGMFMPIFRLDTTLKSHKELFKISDELSMQPFLICLQRLQENPHLFKKEAKPLNPNEVEHYYSKRLSYSFFSDQHKPSRGVFLNFRDLLNNKPSYINFEVNFDKMTDELFVVENDKKTLLDKFWGFCDGEKYYIKIDYKFFELRKENNVLVFWGNKGIVHHHRQTNVPPGTRTLIVQSSRMRSTYRPLQVNMETGTVY